MAISCPSNISIVNDFNQSSAESRWEIPQVSPADAEEFVRVNGSHTPGMRFELGTTTVTYSMYANDGKVVTMCEFNIQVVGKRATVVVQFLSSFANYDIALNNLWHGN